MSDTTEPLPTALPGVTAIGPGAAHDDTITLDYDARFVRRKRLVSDGGRAFLIDLPQARALADGEVLSLSDGGAVAVCAAPEPLLEVRGDLPRLAWHIGNRHTPCRIEDGRLLIRADPVLADMLARLGASVAPLEAPFVPEGGAYGHGRTFGHAHGPADHAHTQTHDHDHDG
jgi:urease accessory protein